MKDPSNRAVNFLQQHFNQEVTVLDEIVITEDMLRIMKTHEKIKNETARINTE